MRSITELTVSDSELDIICPELVHIATDFNPIWVRAHSECGRLAHVTSWLYITWRIWIRPIEPVPLSIMCCCWLTYIVFGVMLLMHWRPVVYLHGYLSDQPHPLQKHPLLQCWRTSPLQVWNPRLCIQSAQEDHYQQNYTQWLRWGHVYAKYP